MHGIVDCRHGKQVVSFKFGLSYLDEVISSSSEKRVILNGFQTYGFYSDFC